MQERMVVRQTAGRCELSESGSRRLRSYQPGRQSQAQRRERAGPKKSSSGKAHDRSRGLIRLLTIGRETRIHLFFPTLADERIRDNSYNTARLAEVEVLRVTNRSPGSIPDCRGGVRGRISCNRKAATTTRGLRFSNF